MFMVFKLIMILVKWSNLNLVSIINLCQFFIKNFKFLLSANLHLAIKILQVPKSTNKFCIVRRVCLNVMFI